MLVQNGSWPTPPVVISDMSFELRKHCALAADGINADCDNTLQSGVTYWKCLFSGADMPGSRDLLGCGEPLVTLLRRQARLLVSLYRIGMHGVSKNLTETDKEILALNVKRLNQIIGCAYRKFYAYVYDQVPLCWRLLYTEACILKFGLIFLSWSEDVCAAEHLWHPGHEHASSIQIRNDLERQLDDMVHTLDRALVLAGAAGDARGRAWIEKAMEMLEKVWQNATCGTPGGGAVMRLQEKDGSRSEQLWSETPSFSSQEKFTPMVAYPVPRIKERSMAEFQRLEDQAHMLASAPIIFTGLTGDWPALTNHPWSKPSYLLSHTFGGRRLVPVEVGRSYLDAGWGQKLVKFGDFMREYIEPGNQQHLALLTGDTSQAGGKAAKAPVGYLAQHQLFSQLPQLYKDVTIPDICFTSPSRHPIDPSKDLPQLDMPQLNAWFGPGGTITPLHTDPYHNLLVQVVGRKYVRLYAPCHSAKLRPMGKENGVDMSNTSSVDVGVMEGWDARPVADGGEGDEDWKFELRKAEFKSVPFVDCILEPGETLHIPVGWWHYVRSLSVSFSVSFWWN